jgi:hypothetical protein
MKNFIKNNFIIKYKKSYGLNSVKLRESWFINNGYEKELEKIINLTEFLGEVTLSERIYCIMNDITIKKKCPYCNNKPIKYANFIEGYRRHCGNRKCSYVDKSVYTDVSGLTANQKSRIGMSKFQKTIIDGKRRSQISGLKSSETKRKTFINGKSMLTLSAERAAKTKEKTILPNGMNVSQFASLKAAKTMNEMVLSGKTLNQLRIEKMNFTKKIVGLDGLDGYERGFFNGSGKNSSIKFYNTNLYYQGTYEKDFLDYMTKNNRINRVKRGERFNYFFNKLDRQYRSDFLYDNDIIIEVKSSWTYGKTDNEQRNLNIEKFKSVLNDGYRLIVVLDKMWFIEVNSDNVNHNLYNEKLIDIEKLITLI